jgi:isomerase DpgB
LAAWTSRIAEIPLSARSEISVRRRLLLQAGSASFDEALGAHLAASDRAIRARAT